MLIRDYCPVDLPYLYDICLRTGDSGRDASSLFVDPFMIGQFYAAPYALFDPRCVLILEGRLGDQVRPLGYMLGTHDTAAYNAWFDRAWRPSAAAMYPPRPETPVPAGGVKPLAERIRALFHQPFAPSPWLERYPGHIHIDLLPEVQGAGWGRKLMDAYGKRLASLGCPGYHLGVGKRNENAVAFYRRYGMTELDTPPWGFVFGLRL